MRVLRILGTGTREKGRDIHPVYTIPDFSDKPPLIIHCPLSILLPVQLAASPPVCTFLPCPPLT